MPGAMLNDAAGIGPEGERPRDGPNKQDVESSRPQAQRREVSAPRSGDFLAGPPEIVKRAVAALLTRSPQMEPHVLLSL